MQPSKTLQDIMCEDEVGNLYGVTVACILFFIV